MSRTLCWFSMGAASAIAARIELRVNPDAMMVRCETNNEDEDNYRFEADVVRWLNSPVTIIQSDEYESVVDVWEKRNGYPIFKVGTSPERTRSQIVLKG